MAPKWSRLECLDNSRDLSRLQQFFFAVAVSLFFPGTCGRCVLCFPQTACASSRREPSAADRLQ